MKPQLYHLLALCPVINDSVSTALSFLICKNHKVVVKIMDYAQHCTWTHAKGSVVERRKPAIVTLWCHCPDSLRQ